MPQGDGIARCRNGFSTVCGAAVETIQPTANKSSKNFFITLFPRLFLNYLLRITTEKTRWLQIDKLNAPSLNSNVAFS